MAAALIYLIRNQEVHQLLVETLIFVTLACCVVIVRRARKPHKNIKKFDSKVPPTCPFSETQHLNPPTPVQLSSLPAYNVPRLKYASNHMTMGLRRLDHQNWLTIDSAYLAEHTIRAHLLKTQSDTVLACLPPSTPACHEVLTKVSTFLAARYPQHFTITGTPHTSTHKIHNSLTQESHHLSPCSSPSPLATAALLAQEDFNILAKSDVDGEYHLLASATLFPAGWKLRDRIGGTIGALHEKVPGWQARLKCPVGRYLDCLRPRTAMERWGVFVQTDGELWKDGLVCGGAGSGKEEDVGGGRASDAVEVGDLFLRRERQTFSRLEISGMVLFGVHTYMKRAIECDDGEIRAMISIAEGWGEDMARYKGRDKWIDVMREYMAGRPSREEVGVS